MKWWEYQKLLDGGPFMTSADHRIIVQRESIPIVFIPGIMGSRLKRGDARVWDPNDSKFMLTTYFSASPEARQQLLGTGGLDVDNRLPDSKKSSIAAASMSNQMGGAFGMAGFSYMPASMQQDILHKADTEAANAAAQGWGGVAWDFYGDYLQSLTHQDWGPANKFFVFPVYAVAYNWTQDNKLSGAYIASQIKEIKAKEVAKGLICEKVIVVSHSMGGLASRAAIKLSGAEGDIFGAVHGAQPATGAPVAFHNMRAGTESGWGLAWVSGRVLGDTSAKVMPILANSVGALELLPTMFYKTNHGQTVWLTQTKSGSTLNAQPKGDPYTAIYANSSSYLRLVYHPEYISPLTANKAKNAPSVVDPTKKAFATFASNVKVAEAFHQGLQLQCHAVTYSAWVGNEGRSTMDTVECRFTQQHYDPVVTPDGMYVDPNPEEGSGYDFWDGGGNASLAGYYEIQKPTGLGDGTVPLSSGGSLKDESKGLSKKLSTAVIKSVEHSKFYGDSSVRQFVTGCIGELAQKEFHDKLGR